MNGQKPLLICIVGATAIGKTRLAIALAKLFQTEIISADSRQFYKEMEIGTAVPTPSELAEIPHHFIQHKSIWETYSVGDFERDALNQLDQLFLKHQIVIMVGGSGLYVDAIIKGLDEFPEVNDEIRNELNELYERQGLEPLQEELKYCDPEYYNEVDLQNPQRVIRALEVYRASGQPFSSFRKNNLAVRSFNHLYIGLDAPREIIYDRINERVDKMIEDGLVDEAKQLWPFKELNALQTVGYRELFECFEGKLTMDEAIEEIKKNTRRFAKRQGTWFRKNPTIHWFDFQTASNDIENFIKKALSL